MHTLGDAPIEDQYRLIMNEMASAIDDILNGAPEAAPGLPQGKRPPRKNGFVLLVFPFEGHEGRCNYISNGADRKDIVVLMKEQIKRFEGQPEVSGRA